MKFTFYIVWGNNTGEKFQFQISRKEPYIFRLIIYRFGICILRRDIEEIIEQDLLILNNLLDIINELVFAYQNKDEELPHTFEILAIKRAYHVLEGKQKEFAKQILQEMENK